MLSRTPDTPTPAKTKNNSFCYFGGGGVDFVFGTKIDMSFFDVGSLCVFGGPKWSNVIDFIHSSSILVQLAQLSFVLYFILGFVEAWG